MNTYAVRVLEEKFMLSILRFLHRNGTSSKMAIYKSVSGNQRMRLKLNALQDSGLITISNSLPTQVSLTGLGEKVSEHIGAIEGALSANTVKSETAVRFAADVIADDGRVFQGHSSVILTDQVGPPGLLERGAGA